jgi:hypothetical protein
LRTARLLMVPVDEKMGMGVDLLWDFLAVIVASGSNAIIRIPSGSEVLGRADKIAAVRSSDVLIC